jgi:hypothetical protein
LEQAEHSWSDTRKRFPNWTGRDGTDAEEGSLIDDPGLGAMFKGSDGEFYPLKLSDMSHKTDVVTWWNSTGRTFGAKSPEVRSWILDADNYVLDYRSIIRRQGALLGNTGVRYLPPLK